MLSLADLLISLQDQVLLSKLAVSVPVTENVEREMVHEMYTRKSFPILNEYHYLDSATANLIPTEVSDAICSYLTNNIELTGKGLHELLLQSHLFIDRVRKSVNHWTGLQNREIVFCNNLAVANEILSRSLNFHDRFDSLVVLTASHSSLLPYHREFLAGSKPSHFMEFTNNAAVNYQSLEKIPPRRNLVIVSPVLLGTGEKVDLNRLLEFFDPSMENEFIVDASLCASYLPLRDLMSLNPAAVIVDAGQGLFLPGTSFIAVRKELSPARTPFIAGDLAVTEVRENLIEYERGWQPYEVPFLEPSRIAGLQHIVESADSEFIKNNSTHCSKLVESISSALEDTGFTIMGPDLDGRKTSIIGFNLTGVSSHDLAMSLDECNVQVRSGLLCSHIMMERAGLSKSNNGLCQISLQHYNSTEDVEALIEGLILIKEEFN